MPLFFSLVLADFRLIFRDRILVVMFFVPVLLVLFVRIAIPFLAEMFPGFAGHSSVLIKAGAVQTAIMYGFVTSFLFLDEKDEQLIPVIRTLPVSVGFIVMYRLLFATIFSAFGAFLMITCGGLKPPGIGYTLMLSLLYGLTAPLIALVLGAFARNKVEGMAIFKATDLILLLPLTAFLLSDGWHYIFAPVPVFWTYELYDRSLSQNGNFGLVLIAILAHMAALFLVYRQFIRRISIY